MNLFSKIRDAILRRISKNIHPTMILGYKQNSEYLDDVRIGNTTVINARENLKIANHVFIGHYNFIEASNGIIIEEGCQISNFVSITTHSSHISIRLYGADYTKYKNLYGYVTGPIHIGKYTFIGPHSVIMPNTTIGKGSIVTAFAYVEGEFPDFSIISGNPAKIIGDTRQIDKIFLENYPELQILYDQWAR